MSSRIAIAESLVNMINNNLDGVNPHYVNNINKCATNEFFKFTEIKEFPYVCVNEGNETTEYLPSRQRWKYFNLSIFVYVKDNETMPRKRQLESIIQDLENLVDSTEILEYTINKPGGESIVGTVVDRSIRSISTDEGILDPFGFGELAITVRYAPATRAFR